MLYDIHIHTKYGKHSMVVGISIDNNRNMIPLVICQNSY